MEILSLIITLAILVFYLICYIKIFTKAGEPGWKAIIPIYGQYTYCKIVWKGSVFFRSILWSVLASVFSTIGTTMHQNVQFYGVTNPNEPVLALIFIILGLIFLLLSAILSIRILHHLSTSFGYGAGMTVCMILFGFIAFPILALGSSVYHNPYRDDNDVQPSTNVTSTERPGSILDSPLTFEEKQILVNIRNKKAMGDRNYTEDEKAVLKKLKWQKEYGVR